MATMMPSTGPFLKTSAGDISTPISPANANGQIMKKLPEIMAEEAGKPFATAMRTSVATMCIHHAIPTSTVTTELQRNHHRAFGIRLGTTTVLILGSNSFRNGKFTILKKYRRPTHTIPAVIWIQRSNIRASWLPPGNSRLGGANSTSAGSGIAVTGRAPFFEPDQVGRARYPPVGQLTEYSPKRGF